MWTRVSHPDFNTQLPTILSQFADAFLEDYWPVGLPYCGVRPWGLAGGVVGGDVPSGGDPGRGTPGAVVVPLGAIGPWPGIATCCMGFQINSHNSYLSPPW